MAKETGGPVNPVPISWRPKQVSTGFIYDDGTILKGEGLTIRDYFAGQALIGLADDPDNTVEVLAKVSYDFADAMIKERNK